MSDKGAIAPHVEQTQAESLFVNALEQFGQ
jgi:hypothetical protein